MATERIFGHVITPTMLKGLRAIQRNPLEAELHHSTEEALLNRRWVKHDWDKKSFRGRLVFRITGSGREVLNYYKWKERHERETEDG